MALSSNLIAQFVKATNDNTPTKKETTGYGTVVDQDGSLYVQLDGSTQVTPVTSTATLKAGDRVTVMIKNHTAIVTGNLSDPSASNTEVKEMGTKISEFDIIIADKVSTSVLEAEKARIDELTADNVTIKEQLNATNADIENLESKYITVTEKLTAAEADIGNLKTDKLDTVVAEATYATITNLDATNATISNLEAAYGDFEVLTTNKFTAIDASIKTLTTDKLSVKDADIKYANVDFSNITKAAMEYFYANSGLIEDVTIGDATITGRLTGVTISGNLIEADTIVAEKLVVKGEDGLYYRLNTDGESVSSSQTEYNSLNGKVLLAKSVTAEKVKVNDLVAFYATIGGFHIADHSIYSGVKASVDNTTNGLYLDDDGQMALGDSDNYIKYYKNEDDSYVLDISAVRKNNDELRELIAEEHSSIVAESQGITMSAVKKCIGFEDSVGVSSVDNYYLVCEETEEGAVSVNTPGWSHHVGGTSAGNPPQYFSSSPSVVGSSLWWYAKVTYSDGSETVTDPKLLYTHTTAGYYVEVATYYWISDEDGDTLAVGELGIGYKHIYDINSSMSVGKPHLFAGSCIDIATNLSTYENQQNIISYKNMVAYRVASYQGSYNELKDYMSSQLAVTSNRIEGRVTAISNTLDNETSDIKDKLETIEKYFTFDINGLTIGQDDNPYKITIDNDRYSMFVNNVEVLWIDIETQEVHTPGITVTTEFNMLGYSAKKDSDGNVNWSYIGGE